MKKEKHPVYWLILSCLLLLLALGVALLALGILTGAGRGTELPMRPVQYI